MDEVFEAPARFVYVHPAEERGEVVQDLRSKVPICAVPAEIMNRADFVQWVTEVLKVGEVLTSKGWMTIPEAKPTEALPHKFEVHLRKAPVPARARDRSAEWAREVLRPFPYSVLDLDGLRRALAEPLPLRLPLLQKTYESLVPEVASFFVPHNEFPAETISAPISTFMTVPRHPGGSESMSQSTWDLAFCSLWSMLPLPVQITFDRNVTDPSGESTRPDLMVWARNRLTIKVEEKRANRNSLYDAYTDLIRKIQNLPAIFFGPVQWIVGVGLAGTQMQVWALKQEALPDALSEELNIRSILDRARCLQLSINFMRLAISLLDVFGPLTSAPRPFCSLQTSRYGREDDICRDILIVSPRVLKIIQPWSKHVDEGFTTLEYVCQAYSGQRVPQLISGTAAYSPEEDKYVARLSPVGYEQMVVGECDLRQAVMDVLIGLRALHEAGLVHRDVRWKNILRTVHGGWMLIDLETVWKECEEPSCWLRAWDAHTLVAGMYTERSDLYLVGKLMVSIGQLSTAAVAFRNKLLDKSFDSADSALEDPWLVNLNEPSKYTKAFVKVT